MSNNIRTTILTILLFQAYIFSFAQSAKNDSLLDAAWNNDIDLVKALILSGADVNYKAYDNASALHYACANNNMDLVQILVKKNININNCDQNNNSPLNICASYGSAMIGEYLVKLGAKTNIKNIDGKDALFISCENNDYIFADMLLYYGATTANAANDSSTIVHVAAKNRNTEMLELLFQHNANPNVLDIYGNYPLYYTFLNDDTTNFALLSKNGAFFDDKGSTTADAISQAITLELPNMIKYLSEDQTLTYDPNASYLYDKAIHSDNAETSKLFKSLGLKKSGKPIFSGIHVLPTFYTNFKDFLSGFTIGTREMNTNIFLNLGFTHRLWTKKVLVNDENSDLLQLREHRGLVSINAGKGFILAQKNRTKFMLIPGITALYSWGNYDGVLKKPFSGYKILPSLETTLICKLFYLSLNYAYLDFNNNLPSSYFQIKCGWTIPFKI